MTDEVIRDLEKELDQTTAALRKELARTRTGRATTTLLDGVSVDYYGTITPLNQLAGLSVPEARLILVQPYDKGAIAEIEKAILQSDLGLMPMNDGKLLRIPIPELTEERRKELVRQTRKIAEDYRVSARNHRRDAIDMLKELEKEKQITEDESHKAQDLIQEKTKSCVEQVDIILKAKEDEIMEV